MELVKRPTKDSSDQFRSKRKALISNKTSITAQRLFPWWNQRKVHPNIIISIMARFFCYLFKLMFSNSAMWNVRLFPEPFGATMNPLTGNGTYMYDQISLALGDQGSSILGPWMIHWGLHEAQIVFLLSTGIWHSFLPLWAILLRQIPLNVSSISMSCRNKAFFVTKKRFTTKQKLGIRSTMVGRDIETV